MLFTLCLTLLQSPAEAADPTALVPPPPPATGYVWIEEGELPLVLSAPHGGGRKPEQAPDRTEGVLKRDTSTLELCRELADRIERDLGARPFVVASELHRIKLDPNRSIEEAAQGGELAEAVWREYHHALEQAGVAAREIGGGRALLVDLHGHAHAANWVELGYALNARQLALDDRELAAETWFGEQLVDVAWVRGPRSFGARLTERGVVAVPSPKLPHPDGKPYFTGGYIVRRHRGGGLYAVQAELPFSMRQRLGRRQSVAALAGAVGAVLEDWFPIPEPAER